MQQTFCVDETFYVHLLMGWEMVAKQGVVTLEGRSRSHKTVNGIVRPVCKVTRVHGSEGGQSQTEATGPRCHRDTPPPSAGPPPTQPPQRCLRSPGLARPRGPPSSSPSSPSPPNAMPLRHRRWTVDHSPPPHHFLFSCLVCWIFLGRCLTLLVSSVSGCMSVGVFFLHGAIYISIIHTIHTIVYSHQTLRRGVWDPTFF